MVFPASIGVPSVYVVIGFQKIVRVSANAGSASAARIPTQRRCFVTFFMVTSLDDCTRSQPIGQAIIYGKPALNSKPASSDQCERIKRISN